jgi:hypothetical protein
MSMFVVRHKLMLAGLLVGGCGQGSLTEGEGSVQLISLICQ